MTPYKPQIEKKVFKLFHSKPQEPHGDYIILPVGYTYNRELLKIKAGDIIEFSDGKRHTVIKAGLIDAKSSAAEALCYIRYGISLTRALQIWKNRVTVLGYGANSINEDECIILTYGKEIKRPNRKNRSR